MAQVVFLMAKEQPAWLRQPRGSASLSDVTQINCVSYTFVGSAELLLTVNAADNSNLICRLQTQHTLMLPPWSP